MKKLCLTFCLCFPLFMANPVSGEESGPSGFHRNIDERKEHGEFQKGQKKHGKNYLRKILKEEIPELFEKIKKMRENRPKVVRKFFNLFKGGNRRILMGLGKRSNQETKDLTKELLNNELESLILGNEYKETTDEVKKTELKQKIEMLLQKSFDLKIQLHTSFVKHMELRMKKVSEMIEKRKELKNRILSERFKDITEDSEEDVMKW